MPSPISAGSGVVARGRAREPEDAAGRAAEVREADAVLLSAVEIQVTPSWAAFSSLSSTMIASTITWYRGMSICLTTASMSWRTRSGPLMMSAFVGTSAQMLTGPVAGRPPSRRSRRRPA